MNGEVNYLFPVKVMRFFDILSQPDLDNVKKSLNFNNHWQTKTNLQNNKIFETLKTSIIIKSYQYLNDDFYVFEDLQINEMWGNVLKPGKMHEPHNHSNNFLSGVFYVESDEETSIRFLDPKSAASIFKPSVKKWTLSNSDTWFYPSTKNSLILFPSYLLHYVPMNNTKNDRISISFNITLKGSIGDDFQKSTF